MTKDEILLLRAADAYYNSHQTLMSDAEFDALQEKVKTNTPGSTALLKVGAVVRPDRVKAKLALPMSSLNKVKYGKGELAKFVAKVLKMNSNPTFEISAKLDGMAGQLIIDTMGKPTTLISRGDGVIGEDWSHLIQYLAITDHSFVPSENVLKVFSKDMVLKVEILINHSSYELFKDEFTSARSMAAGLCNRSDFHPGHRHLRVVMHEALTFDGDYLSAPNISELVGVSLPQAFLSSDISEETINSTYLDFKKTSGYPLDGLVIKALGCPTNITVDNPEYTVAFKTEIEDNCVATTVVSIEWVPTRHGKLFPRVHVKPVKVAGVTIQHATGHNARYIIENKLGAGSEVMVTLNNEVVAGIHSVIAANRVAHEEPEFCVVKMDDHGNHYVMVHPDLSMDYKQARVMHFFKTMGVDQVGPKLVEAFGLLGSLNYLDILGLAPQDLVGVGRMQSGQAVKVFRNIRMALNTCSLYKLMDASGVFPEGIGERRLDQLFANISYDSVKQAHVEGRLSTSLIVGIPGFATTTAGLVVEGLRAWFEIEERFNELIIGDQGELPADFMADNTTSVKYIDTVVARTFAKTTTVKTKTSSKASGMVFLWTGFRDEDQEATVEENGGTVASGFSGKVTHLVVVDVEFTSGKVEKARSGGKCKILTKAEFTRFMETL